MSDFTILKTYKDSYLYRNKLRNMDSDENKNNKTIMDYITNAYRIDKNSEAFAGIIEDIKRQQTSTVVYQILQRSNVVLSIGKFELPRSFKVIEVKDPKANRRPTVFIDCTGLIEYKNGFFICKKIDVLIAYLYNAMIYILYREASVKMFNNTELVISATTCYVSLFTYIIDYLRIIGYAENKSKISYLIGLFFLHNVIGRDIDQYSKNIAAKVAGVEIKLTSAYDFYLNDQMFLNINEFINELAKTFRLKGFNLQVFMGRWINLIGIGTQYAVELFTNFGMLLTSAYSGAYIVNQRQIERSCGLNLIKFNNAVKQVASTTIEPMFKESIEYHEKFSLDNAKAINARNESAPTCKKADFVSTEEATKAVASIVDYYDETKQPQKLPGSVLKIFTNGCDVLESYIMWDSDNYEEGAILACTGCKDLKKILNGSPEYAKVLRLLDDKIRLCQEIMVDDQLDKEAKSRATSCIIELRNAKNAL